jgi:hypothetical protein
VSRKRLAAVAVVGAALAAQSAPAGAATLHDFDQATLASYLSLRFSSAVPPNAMRVVLAREGFSQADLALVTASASAAPSAPTAGGGGGSGVFSAQQISRDTLACPVSDPTPCQLDTQIEPDIAVNPAAPGNLVGVFQQGRFQNGASVDPGWATSFDGGKTWPYGGDAPGLTVAVSSGSTDGPGPPFARASDPVTGFDRKHKAVFLNTLSVSDAGCVQFCDSAAVVNISGNGGKTFGPPVVIREDVSDPSSTSFAMNDRNWIATDNNPASPHYGRTYAVWDQVRCAEPSCTVIVQPVMLSYSDDGGRSWSPAIDVTHAQPAQAHQEVGALPLIMANGDLVIVYNDVTAGAFTFFGGYAAVRSTDGGATWSDPVTITQADPYAEEGASLRAPNVPSAAVDSDGTIWVAFQDQRFGSGRNDILLTTSTDEGQSWSPPLNATPGEANVDHFTPGIAAIGGTVHMTYRTRAPGNVTADPRVDAVYRALKGGVTTRGPLQLYSPSDAAVAAFSTVANVKLKFFGDYAAIAASPKSANPIWDQAQNFPQQQDNPTGTHQRSFSARIQ